MLEVRTASSVPASLDVAGIGNAIVDVISQASDEFLEQFDMTKGSMSLIDADRAIELYSALPSSIEMSGGSAANTMCGVASFGGKAAYLGKVASDDLGDVFGHDLRAVGVSFRSGERDNDPPTGRSMIVVSPDAERTMNTFLGAASLYGKDDLDEDAIASAKVLYLEGYLYDRDPAKEAFDRAAVVAHEHGRQVALSLSDSFCVDRHRSDFAALVDDHVDIVFSNDAELLSLYETDDLDAAIERASTNCDLVVVTQGARGSTIVADGALLEVASYGVADVIDTTGAGDMYAAGFLYGHTHGYDPAASGRLGALAASEVIAHVGPRPLVPLSEFL